MRRFGGGYEKISIIVSIYNVKAYLVECIESILRQTYPNLEIILVEDGSTDHSGLICDEYQDKDARIRVVHKKNGGLSDARNVGVGLSTGQWIGFVDEDDYVHSRMYQVLLGNALTLDADIAECAAYGCVKTGAIIVLRGKEALENLLDGNKDWISRSVVWSKLFRREIIYDLRFPVGMIHEDYFMRHRPCFEQIDMRLYRKDYIITGNGKDLLQVQDCRKKILINWI